MELLPDPKSAFDIEMWSIRARKYSDLDWVNNNGPMNHFLEIAKLKGDEIIVDVGTGSQAVAKFISQQLGDRARIFGFDASRDMISLGKGDKNQNVHVFVGDANNIPMPASSVDLVIARMVYHHLKNPVEAIKEAVRITKTGGRVFIAEHVVMDEEVRQFEKVLFEAKEPGRNLWTVGEIEELAKQAGLGDVVTHMGMLEQYSMTEWMINSGLDVSIQQRVLRYFSTASEGVRKKLKINTTSKGILMDGYYACVVGTKV